MNQKLDRYFYRRFGSSSVTEGERHWRFPKELVDLEGIEPSPNHCERFVLPLSLQAHTKNWSPWWELNPIKPCKQRPPITLTCIFIDYLNDTGFWDIFFNLYSWGSIIELHGHKLERWVGIEPTTACLENRDSTTELPSRKICLRFVPYQRHSGSDYMVFIRRLEIPNWCGLERSVPRNLKWRDVPDSNRQPLAWQASALTIELTPQKFWWAGRDADLLH